MFAIKNKQWFKINIALTRETQLDVQWNNFCKKTYTWWWLYTAETYYSKIGHILNTKIKIALRR
jgi:hypothetical protein